MCARRMSVSASFISSLVVLLFGSSCALYKTLNRCIEVGGDGNNNSSNDII